MQDYINIGPTPTDEDCVQVGSLNYESLSRIECSRYRSLLQAMYPQGIFKVKSFSHDFGTYYEVCAFYDSEDEDSEALKAALEAESSPYTTWASLEEAVKERLKGASA